MKAFSRRLGWALALVLAWAALGAASANAATSPLDWALNTGSGAQPVYAVDNSNADVEIGTLNSSTHQFSLVATDVAGGSGASSSTFLRGDMTWAAPPTTAPAGSSACAQYNNAGAFGCYADLTFGGTTATFAGTLTGPDGTVWNASGVTFNSTKVVTLPDGTAANSTGLHVPTTGSLLIGNTVQAGLSNGGAAVLDVGNGTAGDTSGTLKAAIVDALSAINTPDGGSITSTLVDTFSPIRIRSTGGQTAPTLFAGSSSIYMDGATTRWNDDAHTNNSVGGLALYGRTVDGSGGVSCSPGAYPFCYAFDIGLYTSAGVVVASVEDQGNWFSIGTDRFMSCPAQGDQGCSVQGLDYVSQLLLNDAIAGGLYSEPMIVMQSGDQVGGLTGVGHAAPATIGSLPTYLQNMWRLGAVQDLDTGWDDTAAHQPDLGLEGCLSLGEQNGSAGVASGGVGVTWEERICDNGGVLSVYNTTKSAYMPLAASFYRTTPVTVSGLSTADPSPSVGDRATVTDATACTFDSAVTGGGSTKCPVVFLSSWAAG